MIEEQGRKVRRVKAPPRRGDRCLNCGSEIGTNFCPHCGQPNSNHNMSVWQFFKDFLQEFIGLDSKLVRTLKPLLIRPGFLTSEWAAGRRARYISPLKLYLTLSAICFLILSLRPPSEMVSTSGDDGKGVTISQSDDQPHSKAGKNFEEILTRELTKLNGSGPEAAANRKRFVSEFMARLPTANFILLPIFALYFKLLYARRSRFYVEHLVFALHYYSVCYVGFTLSTLIPLELLKASLGLYMIGYLPVAMYFNYRQGIIKTLFKWWIFSLTAYVFIMGFTSAWSGRTGGLRVCRMCLLRHCLFPSTQHPTFRQQAPKTRHLIPNTRPHPLNSDLRMKNALAGRSASLRVKYGYQASPKGT